MKPNKGLTKLLKLVAGDKANEVSDISLFSYELRKRNRYQPRGQGMFVECMNATNEVIGTHLFKYNWFEVPLGLSYEVNSLRGDTEKEVEGALIHGKYLSWKVNAAHDLSNEYYKDSSFKAKGMQLLLKNPEAFISCKDTDSELQKIGLYGSDVFKLGMKRKDPRLIRVANAAKAHALQVNIHKSIRGDLLCEVNYKHDHDLLLELTCEPDVAILFLYKKDTTRLKKFCEKLSPVELENVRQAVANYSLRYKSDYRTNSWGEQFNRYCPLITDFEPIEEGPLTSAEKTLLAKTVASKMSPLLSTSDTTIRTAIKAGADKDVIFTAALNNGNLNWAVGLLESCKSSLLKIMKEEIIRDDYLSGKWAEETWKWTTNALARGQDYESSVTSLLEAYKEHSKTELKGKVQAEIKYLVEVASSSWLEEQKNVQLLTEIVASKPEMQEWLQQQLLRQARNTITEIGEAMEADLELS